LAGRALLKANNWGGPCQKSSHAMQDGAEGAVMLRIEEQCARLAAALLFRGLGARAYSFSKHLFHNRHGAPRSIPQGLKPAIYLLHIGTAEAVPFQNQVMKQLQVVAMGEMQSRGLAGHGASIDSLPENRIVVVRKSDCRIGSGSV